MSRGVLAVACAIVWASPVAAGEVRRGLTIDSDALGRPLPYVLYLPDAYVSEPDRRFAVIYLLHGHGGDATSWVDAGRAPETADRLIEAGAIPPVILVMPGAGNSWYVDSGEAETGGMMATALTGDLIDHVDSTYRTRARRDGRAIAGLSMGGFGALHLAFAAPDVFAAAASLSGALFVGRPEGVSIDDLFGDVFGEPFELARYRAASPLGRAGELEEPSELPEIYLTSGDDDFFGFFEGAALLFLQLREVGARAELRISDGDHDWAYWRAALDPALRFLTARLRSAGDNVLEQPGGR